MAWIFNSRTGIMRHTSLPHQFQGYAGTGAGRNNPDMEFVPNTGPLPRAPSGYRIYPPKDSPRTGPFTLGLEPVVQSELNGRFAFRIHGDNAQNDASNGCIILNRTARTTIWLSQDRDLVVEG